MKRIRNSKKESFLSSIPTASLDSDGDDLTKRCKFNFSYLDSTQKAGQKIEDWSLSELQKLFDKLHQYSRESLKYWQKQPIGSGRNHVLEIYKKFPVRSDFQHPKHVPHQVLWSRFRLEGSVRLVGFVVPDDYDNKRHKKTQQCFDCNTFYVVFLDAEHRFYKTGRKK